MRLPSPLTGRCERSLSTDERLPQGPVSSWRVQESGLGEGCFTHVSEHVYMMLRRLLTQR